MKVILMQRIKEAYQYILIHKKEKLIHNIRKTIDSLKEMRLNLNKY
jgi:hypothetical protein